ncbi:MAG: hypothetical protein ACYDDS_02560 [Candidatus Sulfotelmatobacter sp.]
MIFSPSRLPKAVLLFVLLNQLSVAVAASKPHILTFGKWATIQCSPDSGSASEGEKPLTLKVRPLLVDARVKEFTFGIPHDVTDRLFVVRRAFRFNDSLPQEPASSPHWQWQPGGWLLVDRLTGHISPLNLPEFDAFYSPASWYRDYVAYCGVSDDGKKIYAVVAQINRRKPVLKKLVESARDSNQIKDEAADSVCPIPTWQRNPSRVTFEVAGIPKQTFAIRAHSVDLITEEDEDEEASK